ncbi:stress-activated map kinase interacting protein 1-domain-containing protein [Flammula alnicola]|nr:stress-activated map kinase interacting protein 1-domain-containing protein [Flammula alnicola]
MSLIRDTEFLIHRLRLLYLRDIDDPYGARIISLDPSYHSNPYILSASLADAERWPQLTLPSSPNLTEGEEESLPGFPASRLHHSRITDERSGGPAHHIHDKESSSSKPLSDTPRLPDMKSIILDDTHVQEALCTNVPGMQTAGQVAFEGGSWVEIAESDKERPSKPAIQVQEATALVDAPVAKVVQFIPKFKGAAEMEARRRLRMAARRGPGAAPVAQPAPSPKFDFSWSSEDEDVVINEASSDEFEGIGIAVTDMDEGDEFDLDFAATRASATLDNALNLTSNGSADVGSAMQHSPLLPPQKNTNLNKQDDEYRSKRPGGLTGSAFRTRGNSNAASSGTHDNMFAKKRVLPLRPLKSALSMKLASGNSSNPFTEMYGAISGRGEAASTKVQAYFPHAEQPRGIALTLRVRHDATVEEAIGFALWTYWEEGWLPKLDDGLKGEDDPKWATRLSAVGWILRMAEDDGEVDDDCPAPDRTKKATEFSDVYAILEATPIQGMYFVFIQDILTYLSLVQQNQLLESQIQRRPSRTSASKRPERLNLPNANFSTLASGNAMYGSMLGSMLSTSLGPLSSRGPQILLRIHAADAVHTLTTIPVYSGMYMQEALELVCRKRKLENPNDYALLVPDRSIVIPLDRTVASLQGKRELSLVKRSMLPQIVLKNVGKTTDPHASIFKRMSETPEQQSPSALDFTAAYKKYTIYRKIPMLVARQERTLAIDGDYIHIMPSTNKARVVFDSGKTSSYHIKSIANCQQSTTRSSIFRLVLSRGAASKRCDFEAESPRLAAEIVQNIKNLKAALERSGTLHKSRRSRQVVL